MNKQVLATLLGLSAFQAKKYSTFDGGPTFEITYDSELSKFKFEADLVKATDLELIFNHTTSTPITADKTDMMHFVAGKEGRIEDLYGNQATQEVDMLQDFTGKNVTIMGDNYHFVAYRKANTYDKKDIEFVCGTTINSMWSVTPIDKTGNWNLELNGDCSVKDEEEKKEETAEPPKEEPTFATHFNKGLMVVGASALALQSVF